MDRDVALKIFALGFKFGNEQSKLGLDIEKQSDERLCEILLKGLEKNKTQIQEYAKKLNAEKAQLSWWAEKMAAKTVFRFGLLSGFDEWPKVKPDKCGKKILTEEQINKLTAETFKNSEYSESEA